MTTDQIITQEIDMNLDAEELMLLERTVSKIKRHLDRNLEIIEDRDQANRLMEAKWYIAENF